MPCFCRGGSLRQPPPLCSHSATGISVPPLFLAAQHRNDAYCAACFRAMAHPTLHAFRPALGQGTGPPVRMTLRSETKKPRFFKDSESRLSDKNQRNPGGGNQWAASPGKPSKFGKAVKRCGRRFCFHDSTRRASALLSCSKNPQRCAPDSSSKTLQGASR